VSKSIRGDLDAFSLPDLLQWLEVSRQSGRVTLIRGTIRRSIDLQGGKIVFASSTRPEERLGAYLVRNRILTPGAAYASLAENLLTGRNLTRIILESGLATRDCLARAVEGLAVEILLDSFRWKGATFEFDSEVPTEDILQIHISLRGQTLAMQGAKAVDELPGTASGTAEAATTPSAWNRAFSPEAATDTFWKVLDRASPLDAAPGALRGLFSDFQRFVSELCRRLSGPLRFAPIYDDTAVLLRRALAGDSSDDQLIQISALDPFLTLNLVSFANALRIQPEPIPTPGSAAAVVGPEAFRLFLDLSSRRDAPKTASANPLERVIRASSISTAVAASRVARRLKSDQETAYTGGLLAPLAAYEPLQALLAVGFEPGQFRAGVLHEYRSLCGTLLAMRWGLPEEHAALLGSSGNVTAASLELVKLVYYASQLVSPEGIGCELSSEDPELVELSASLASDHGLLAEIRHDTEGLFEIIGLP
jgi:HD-like signal output (HDOD) protein